MARRYWIYRTEERNASDRVAEAGYFDSPGEADAVVAALEAETGNEYYRSVYRDEARETIGEDGDGQESRSRSRSSVSRGRLGSGARF